MEGGPPGFGRGFTCPALIGIPAGRLGLSATGLVTRSGRTFQSVRLAFPVPCAGPATPGRVRPGLAFVRFRSPLLAQSRLMSSPRGTEMFHFPRCRPGGAMCSPRRRRPIAGGGFPHSEIRGSGPDDGSPRLIAVFRVLLRLMPPRHPPRARMRLARYAFASLSRRVASSLQFQTLAFQRTCAAQWMAGGPDKSRTCDLVLIRDAL